MRSSTSSSDSDQDYGISDCSLSEDLGSYEIERILHERRNSEDQTHYLVKWKDYPDVDSTWEPKSHFETKDVLQDWERQRAEGDVLDEETLARLEQGMVDQLQKKDSEKAERSRKRQKIVGQAYPTKPAHSKQKNAAEARAQRVTKQTTEPRPALTAQKPTQSAASQVTSFHGISFKPRKPQAPHPSHQEAKAGQKFRNLHEQNLLLKSGRREKAPDTESLKLKTVEHWAGAGGEDTALNFPVFNRSETQMANPTASTQVLAPQTVFPTLLEETGLATRLDSDTNRQVFTNRQMEPMVARNGRSYFKGDLLVHFSLEDFDVGDVRLIEVPWVFGRELVATKMERHSLILHFENANKVSRKDSRNLYRLELKDLSIALDGYEDTQEDLVRVAAHLEAADTVVIWSHPSVSFSMVLYPTLLESWSFLSRGIENPQRFRLRLAIYNEITISKDFNHREPPEATTHDSDGEVFVPQDYQDLESHTVKAQPRVDSRSLLQKPDSVDKAQTAREDTRPTSQKTSSENTHITPSQTNFIETKEPSEVDVSNFDIIWRRLTNGEKRLFVYYDYPEEATAELQALYLLTQDRGASDFTSLIDGDYENFLQEIKNCPKELYVLILVHTQNAKRYQLKGLTTLLRRDNVNCFEVGNWPGSDKVPSFIRLFPKDTALLITEACFLQNSVSTLQCLKWALETADIVTGKLRLMVQPGMPECLLEVALVSPAETTKCLIEMVVILRKLAALGRKKDSEVLKLTGDPWIESIDEGVIMSAQISSTYHRYHGTGGQSQDTPKSRDRWLVNCFSGWALKNIQRYRSFVALTPFQDAERLDPVDVCSASSFYARASVEKSIRVDP